MNDEKLQQSIEHHIVNEWPNINKIMTIIAKHDRELVESILSDIDMNCCQSETRFEGGTEVIDWTGINISQKGWEEYKDQIRSQYLPKVETFMCPHPKDDGWPCRERWPKSEGDICPKCGKDWTKLPKEGE